MPTTAQILQLAPIAQYLASNNVAKRQLFGGGFDTNLPTKIFAVNYVIQEIYSFDPTYTGLDACAQYLWQLCGRWGLAAQQISGSGSTAGSSSGSTASRIDFIVSVSSYIPTGDASKTITQFIGFNVDFIRNGVSQSTISTESSYISFNRSTGLLTITPALADGELISIIPT